MVASAKYKTLRSCSVCGIVFTIDHQRRKLCKGCRSMKTKCARCGAGIKTTAKRLAAKRDRYCKECWYKVFTPQCGPDRWNWNGGRTTTVVGYVRVRRPDHPRADSNGYVAEHVLVAEKKIGRLMKDDENVHHLNEKKGDNREENLRVMRRGDHTRLHAPHDYRWGKKTRTRNPMSVRVDGMKGAEE
jgi:hypothetical protein